MRRNREQLIHSIVTKLSDKVDDIKWRFQLKQIDEATADMELADLGFSYLTRKAKLVAWKAGR